MFTYTWSNAVSLVNKMIKGTPTSTIDAQVCDLVSDEMYRYWPWSWTLTSGVLCTPTDSNQDFSPPANVYRLLRARMVRTDTTPNQNIELTVRNILAPDLVKRSYTAIGSVAFEQAVGQIRLTSAIEVPSGVVLSVQGEWQVSPAKISNTSQGMWFPDQYMPIACEGLLYWYYKLNDDPRAGGKQTTSEGRTAYAGQYGNFMTALSEMSRAEDYPATDVVFPDEPMGIGRSYLGTLNLYGS